ncbi:hypothetical protein [Bradyrhizobium sp. USDA 4486]
MSISFSNLSTVAQFLGVRFILAPKRQSLAKLSMRSHFSQAVVSIRAAMEAKIRTFSAILVLLSGMLLTAPAMAQCANNVNLSCNVYATCFAKYCPCKEQNEYFLAYGKKYCEKFLGLSNFSQTGVKWRDKTLLCLQEAIVPKLDISENPSCDCKAMRAFAFETHVKCYLSDPSICTLPATDMLKILNTVGLGSTITDPDSRTQFKAVLSKCLGSFAGEALKALQTTVTALSD